MRIKGSRILHELLMSHKTGRVLEGGSRSTKTWSIIQWIMLYCQQHRGKGKSVTICRDSLTWIEATVFKDFKEVLTQCGWWRDKHFNKGEMKYYLWDNEISFIGLSEPAKLHGRKQNIFWINEAIGTPGSAFNPSKEVFDQLEMRTTDGWFLDYNPKVTSHWIFDSVLTRPDVQHIHSTMLTNPFLESKIRAKILSYQPTTKNISRGTADRVKWLIYGEGRRAQHEGLIFTNIRYVRDIPAEAKLIGYGLDFGFTNDVSALMKVAQLNGELWIDEILYETGLTNADLSRAFEKAGIKTTDDIIADSAEQKSIAELKAKGWNIKGAVKGHDSIQFGIDVLKKYRINITERSVNFKNECESYVWKEDLQTGKLLNQPIDDFNHAWDAIRYVAMMRLATKRTTTIAKAY